MALAEFISALDRTDEIELGTVGRVSGQENYRPVWFVRNDNTLFLLPVSGSASQWYRNVRQTPKLHLTAEGAEYETPGRPITDPDRVQRVVADFREKYGADNVAKYYQNPDVAVEAPLTA